MRVLVLNAGSSSLKASEIETPEMTLGRAEASWGSDASRQGDPGAGLDEALRSLTGVGATLESIEAVGHRVVHGGLHFTAPVVVDDEILAGIEEVSALAPLHNGVALDVIRAARERLPNVPHIACFDTAFHATLEPAAFRYPVPRQWYEEWGVRRFGFHGLSVDWAVQQVRRERPDHAAGIVVAHLGSGCSVTAVRDGRSVHTSMGLTPLEGLMMGTRSGSVDPGMLLRLLSDERFTVAEMGETLDHASGLLGVSGVSGDVRQVQAAADAGDENAALALDLFLRRAAQEIASAATALPRVETLVFTGGIGEHATRVRGEIVARLRVLGLGPDQVLVVEAREDVVIAQETQRLIASFGHE